jgi:hypothetical protein
MDFMKQEFVKQEISPKEVNEWHKKMSKIAPNIVKMWKYKCKECDASNVEGQESQKETN